MKRALLVGIAAFVVGAVFTTIAVVHDRRIGLHPDELANVVPAGSGEEAAFALLRALEADPPDHTTVVSYPSETVEQYECFPRPCSLVDRGVPAGFREQTVRVAIKGHWIPNFCTDEYIAHFIFDERGELHDFIAVDADACL